MTKFSIGIVIFYEFQVVFTEIEKYRFLPNESFYQKILKTIVFFVKRKMFSKINLKKTIVLLQNEQF